eukprot:m.324391 g.324391  ORF g.324391 m.324391 type:complete len:391 (+) comp16462_c0_seq2:31-1203(+)
MLAAAATIVVIIFFSVPVIAQIALQRLPHPEESLLERLAEAGRPSRCCALWSALLDQLRYVTYLPMYTRLKRAYSMHPNELKAIPYGSPSGHTLDLFLPESLRRRSESHLASTPTNPPVALFVHGGAWEHGERSMYVELGQTLADHGYVAAIADYTKFNEGHRVGKAIGDVGDGTTDVVRCMLWLSTTVRPELGLTGRNKLVLFGHSSGAHLVANAAVGLMLRASRQAFDATAFHADVETALTPVWANALLRQTHAVVGLCGVYDITDHIAVEEARGVEWVSAMHRVMQGRDRFALHSPAESVLQLQNTTRHSWPQFVLLHGDADITVPAAASTKFAKALGAVGADVSMERFDGASHTSVLLDLMCASKTAPTVPARRMSGLLSDHATKS